MKLRPFLFVLLLLLAILLPVRPAQSAPDGWEVLAPGIGYQKFFVSGPNNVFVARMDRNQADVTLETMIARGHLYGTSVNDRETVSDMAVRYDQAINYWGEGNDNPYWGTRNKVVVAINGSFFDPYTGIPWGGMVQSGWYAKRFDTCVSGSRGSGFGWTMDRGAFIGQSVSHIANKQLITFGDGSTLKFQGINRPRGSNELVVYTPQYDSNTHTDNSGVEVLVELSRPALIVNQANQTTGIVRKVVQNQGSSLIPFNYIVLSATGDAKTTLLAKAGDGTPIGISQEIKSYEFGCGTSLQLDWTKTYASLDGSFYFLRDGVVFPYADDGQATARQPRTAIAFNNNYIYFVVVDGRDTGNSIGMSMAELGTFLRDRPEIQATNAVNQDGGGSSTMWVNGVVVNNTYCNNVYCTAKLFVPRITSGTGQQSAPEIPPAAEAADELNLPMAATAVMNNPDVAYSADILQRLVANGMMMVVVEPFTQSAAFMAGDTVKTTDNVNLRLGPGTNYTRIVTISNGSQGVVLDDMNDVNGVLAKGLHWWKVKFGTYTGWMAGEFLTKVP